MNITVLSKNNYSIMNTFSTINQKTTKNLQQPGVVQIIVQPEGCTVHTVFT